MNRQERGCSRKLLGIDRRKRSIGAMSSSFDAGEVSRVSSGLFDNDGYLGFDPHPSSNAYTAFADGDDDAADDSIRISSGGISLPSGGAFVRQELYSPASPFPIPYSNGNGFGVEAANGIVFVSDFPPHSEMPPDEGFFLREWCRQNAMLLEEKERVEKELREQIIIEADEYKIAYNEKRKVTSATNRTQNREREKLFLANQVKFHASADKDCWKAIAELIPNEVPNIDKKRAKKEQEKKPSVAVIQGPKPGKPTDLSRMRQLLLKLKHSPPPHINTSAAAPASAPAPAPVVVDAASTKPAAPREVVVIA